METGIKSSFIPQSPVMGASPRRRSGGGGFDFFVLIGLVLFVASATLAAGVFLYVQFLQSSNASKLEQLERAKAAFEPALIRELTRLDDRMRAADEVLAKHVAPTALFALLEQLTLQTVAFSSFDFTTGSEKTTLTMQGLARSVNSIALQADLLSRSGTIVSPIFSDINRQIGGVRFNFTANIRPEALNYRALTSAPNPQLQPQQQQQQPASPFGEGGSGAPEAEQSPQSGAEQAPQASTTPQQP
nr:hypothetical protein [uncultured bacterium]